MSDVYHPEKNPIGHMPRVSFAMRDRQGFVTEFTLDSTTITTPEVFQSMPQIDQAIRALVMWKDWQKVFLKHRIESDAGLAVGRETRQRFIEEHPQEAAAVGISKKEK